MVTRISKDGATDATEKDPTASALDALADRADANNTPPPAAPPAPANDGLEADLLAALLMAQSVARQGIWWLTPTEFEQLWGDATLKGIAEPGAEIMRRHGFTVAGVMSKYGPYLALLAAVAPPAIATTQAYKAATVRPRQAPPPAPAAEASHGNQTG